MAVWIATAANGPKDVVESLLARNADVSAKGNGGETPLDEAALAGHKDVAGLPLANKAEVCQRTTTTRLAGSTH